MGCFNQEVVLAPTSGGIPQYYLSLLFIYVILCINTVLDDMMTDISDISIDILRCYRRILKG